MWSKTTLTYTDNTTSDTYSVAYFPVNGATGATGNGISSYTAEFYLSTSKATQSGGSWVTSPPHGQTVNTCGRDIKSAIRMAQLPTLRRIVVVSGKRLMRYRSGEGIYYLRLAFLTETNYLASLAMEIK
ncbi:hypothetical protein V4S33_07135 [Enterococcus cecorum]